MRGGADDYFEKEDEPPPLTNWNARIYPGGKKAETLDQIWDYIPLVDGVLAFGGPMSTRCAKALCVDCIVDLTDSTAEAPWWIEYISPAIEVCRKYKIEARREEDTDLDDAQVVRKIEGAARFVKMQCQGGKRHVYVLGWSCTRVACVVALVAWVLLKNVTRDPVEYLHKDVLKDIEWLTRDFPATPKHTDIIHGLIKKHRQSIEAGFPGLTATKRQKINK
jgi:hypothetical protein